MKEILKKTFEGIGSGKFRWGVQLPYQDFSGFQLNGCSFISCHAGNLNNPIDFSEISLESCSQQACSVTNATFQQIEIKNFKTKGRHPLFLWGCRFRDVVFEGRIGNIKINRELHSDTKKDSQTQKESEQTTIDFYKNVDVAIDIRKARFTGSIDFHALPGDRILFNPDSAALIHREKWELVDLAKFDSFNSSLPICISWFLSRSLFDTTVLVAAGTEQNYGKDLSFLNFIREEGLVEK